MKNTSRHYSALDQLCLGMDQALRAIVGSAKTSGRPYPAIGESEPVLSDKERKHAAGLMRVNHAGEVSAQALYHAQGLISKNQEVRQHMQDAAMEEGDHLDWCSKRLSELGSHTSYLNPVWYAGSFAIGLVAGWVGDEWSLGFVAETEQQVVKHLEKHLQSLPEQDLKSAAILREMQIDEAKHRDEAIQSGAKALPLLIKKLMNLTSKMMVKTAYWF
jgi:ubiquinone biosynthesis monooxygenase Coq7